MLYHMDSKLNISRLETKTCAGRGCGRVGKMVLKVLFINKTGLFCDSCTNDLLVRGLAVKIGDISNE